MWQVFEAKLRDIMRTPHLYLETQLTTTRRRQVRHYYPCSPKVTTCCASTSFSLV
jgi:hypothetical protein